MSFSSIIFIFAFMPISLLLYQICPKAAKNVLLLLISLAFYAWGSPIYLILFGLVIVIGYAAALEMEYLEQAGMLRQRKLMLILAVAANLLPLFFYKYLGFIVSNLGALFRVNLSVASIALPAGISFFTFQALSYLFDVYYGKANTQHNLLNYALYIAFFPKLLSGPIIQYKDMELQLSEHPFQYKKVRKAVPMFLIGLAKKVLIADNLAIAYAAISGMTGSRSVLTAWIGAICYTLELYYDFSGYSDMAIALGAFFGFDLPKNFDYPYISNSISDFWRRWHITLGAWFRDYVYIPMGGSRVTVFRNILNLMVVWMLTGLWHGSAWTFIFWGLFHGIIQILEKFVFKNILEKIPVPIRIVVTFTLVLIGWVFFFSPSLGSAFTYLGQMFGVGAAGFIDQNALYYLGSNWVLILIAFFCANPKPYQHYSVWVGRGGFRVVLSILLYLLLFVLCVAFMLSATYQTFLYFAF